MDLAFRQVVADATSSDDAPTPGYMLQEISRKFLRRLRVSFETTFLRNRLPPL